MKEKYVIQNTTVKAAIPGKPRSLSEKNGYNVSFRDAKDNVTLLRANEHIIVTNVPDSVWSLESDGLVSIRKMKDIGEQLKDHVLKDRRTRRRGAPKEAASEETTAAPASKRMAKAVEMGKDQHTGSGDHPEENAVPTNGQPNFVVTAPSAETRRKRRSA